MTALSAHEHFKLFGESEVVALLNELGLSDWPSHHVDEGVLVRGVPDHETHWIVFLCLIGDEEHDWIAFGFPKSKFTRELAEEIVAETTGEFGARGPFFGPAFE